MKQTRKYSFGHRMCMHGGSCIKYGCTFIHPPSRPKDCPHGANCRLKTCKLHHPRSNKEVACRFGSQCDNSLCPFSHPSERTTNAIRKNRTPCMHGAFCVKFGCTYVHPPERKQECELGVNCNDVSCCKLHPLPKKQVNPKSNFVVGQQVEAQYNVGSSWRLATVCSSVQSVVTLQFVGWDDVKEIPLERIRHVPEYKSTQSVDIPPGFSFISRGSAVGLSSPKRRPSAIAPRLSPVTSPRLSSPKRLPSATSPTPSSKYYKPKIKSDNLIYLERLKQQAIQQEDYLLAAKLKVQIQKIAELEIQKDIAARKEDFLLAMEIKEQIINLTTIQSTLFPMCQQFETKPPSPIRRQPVGFSLFENQIKVC